MNVSKTHVRVVSRWGGAERLLAVTGASGKLLLGRWDGGAPVEFSLTHGCIQASPQWDWLWRLHPDELATLREELKIKGEVTAPPMRRQRPSAEAKAHSRDAGQLEIWGASKG